MKSKSLRYSIIFNLVISVILAAVSTVFLLMISMTVLYIISKDAFYNFSTMYNNNRKVMECFFIICLAMFIIIFIMIFLKSINKIINYINEISYSLNQVSNGNMDINIPIRSDDELGMLADDSNKMAFNIKTLMEKERMMEKQRNNLITNLSHDLKTPLTSILGFLKIIQDGNYEDEESLKHYCSIALNKAKELNESINQLLEFSSINDGDIKLNKKKVRLDELMQQVVMGFIPTFEKNNMECRISVNSEIREINIDVKLMVRAFENLITNSIKYGVEGRYLDIELKEQNNMAVINFINYGEEIKQKDLDNLFERFYRSEKTCDKKEGTGLGLAIVKKVIVKHGGNIKVDSSKEKTEFIIELPFD